MRPILLIEDDRDVRDTLTEFLEGEGYVVNSARHGREGIEWLESHPEGPSLILLDMMMPIMNGREFLEFLREKGKYPIEGAPVMIFSAGAEAQELALEFGAGLVPKLDLDRLLEAALRYCAPGQARAS